MALALLALGASVRADDGSGWGPPVFFKTPDPATEKKIQSDLALLKETGISDHTRGRKALEKVGYWAVAPLRERLKNGGPAAQRNAALVLGVLRFPGTMPDLLHAAETNAHETVQAFAALMAGRFQDPAALGRLDAIALHSRRNRLRIASLLAMAKIGGPRAAEFLAKAIPAEDNHLVQEAGLFCLGFFRAVGLSRGPHGEVPCPALRAALASGDMHRRRAATLALALLGDPDLLPYYVSAVRDRREIDVSRRCIGLLALGSFEGARERKLFLETIQDPATPHELALTAAFMIENSKSRFYRPWLLSVDPTDARLRAALTLALSNYEGMDVVKRLAMRLSDRQDVVKAAAAIALSRVHGAAEKKLAVKRLSFVLDGKGGTVGPNARYDLRRARSLLEHGQAPGQFLWLGSHELVEDLKRNVPQKLVDLANREAARVLGLGSLTDLKTSLNKKNRFRVSDPSSGLRDLKQSLASHPYFTVDDLPGVRTATTPALGGRSSASPRRPTGEGK